MKSLLKRILSRILSAGILSAFLLGAGLSYGKNLEQKVSKVDINFNYEYESAQKSVNYHISNSRFFRDNEILLRDFNIPELTYSEKNQVENIMKDIKHNDINSYQELVEKTKDFSENQKLVLLSAIGGILRDFNYENSNEKVASQNIFFEKLQDSLATGERNGLGVCRHISSHLEKLANDIGIKASAVTGFGTTTGHVYVISKTENGNSIVDYSEILTFKTKDVEKTLEAYQKHWGTTVFQHLFFKDSEFKYRLITRDGKHLLNFVEYDETTKPLKNTLIQDFNLQPDLKLTLDFEKYLNSFEFNYKGLFVKAGEIKGDILSPLNEINLIQTGFKRKFSLLSLSVNPDISLIKGKISQDRELDDNNLLGVQGNLIVSTNNKRLNFNARTGWNVSFLRPSNFPIFYDYVLGAGISYKIHIKNSNTQPYTVMQFAPFIKDIGSGDFKLAPEELRIGTIFNMDFGKRDIALEPYYLWRIWEDKFGINTGFNNKYFKLSTGAYITKSKYDFCPDKIGFKIGLETKLRNFNFKIDYEGRRTDYDKEKEWDNFLNASVNIKY